jgi:hypothetical protein
MWTILCVAIEKVTLLFTNYVRPTLYPICALAKVAQVEEIVPSSLSFVWC